MDQVRGTFIVFPAPAGINRFNILRGGLNDGVPRASGDKPQSLMNGGLDYACSPRQRG